MNDLTAAPAIHPAALGHSHAESSTQTSPMSITGPMVDSEPAAAKPAPLGPDEVELEVPIQRGNQLITRVTVRRPRAGELRGLQLAELLRLDVTSLQAVLPRITNPLLTKPDCENLDPADLLQLGEKVSAFLLRKADRQIFHGE